MNLAGNQAKQLFKSLRTGSSPSVVGLWAAATAVDQVRKRTQRPQKELIVSKKLKPGESYVIRMPGKAEGSLAESVAPDTRVAEIETSGEGSIASQLFDSATELIGAATQPPTAAPEPNTTASLTRRQRRRAARAADEAAPAKPSRRQRRTAAESDDEDPAPGRRRRRKAAPPVAPDAVDTEDANGSFASALVDVAASFMGSEEEAAGAEPATPSRRQRRRSARLASLDETELDRDALPRRRRRKLDRSERRASRRPSRRRVRNARKHQRRAARSSAKIERRAQPSRRRRRKIRAAERELERRRAKVEKRSTRRRRRKLRQAENAFEKLS